MKRGIIVLLLLGILLVLPLVQAQEQTQTYSGFNRFIDNVKMFFSFGDKKVMLASEIREKEVNSAIVNTKNGDDEEAEKNLEGAWKRLQFIQEKVSFDTAEEMKENSEEVRTMIVQEGNLSNEFAVYVLEEEKTGLTAEWIIEEDGEGGNLTREVVTDGIEGRTIEIEKRIDEIDNEIKEWVIDSFDKTIDGDDGLTWVVANKIIKEDSDDGLTREVKTYVAGDGTGDIDDDFVPGRGGDTHYDPSITSAPGDTIVSDDVDETPPVDSGDDLDDTDASDDVIDEGLCDEGESDCAP